MGNKPAAGSEPIPQLPTVSALPQRGYAIALAVLPPHTIAPLQHILQHTLQDLTAPESTRFRHGRLYAVRNLLQISPQVQELASSPPLLSLAKAVLGDRAFPVKAILFDKIPAANWKVPWHQDVTIAVKERHQIDGFGSWTHKAGIRHVQPPDSVLERMVALRLHLDDCDVDNGALKVIPHSHQGGKLTAAHIKDLTHKTAAVACPARAGDVLLMRPLLVHSSSACSKPGHRRIIHIEYAAADLPGQLAWSE